MNKTIDENCHSELRMRTKDHTRKNKYIIFTKPNISSTAAQGINAGHMLKIKETSKIIKIDNINKKSLSNVKIEFSKDKCLLDKLFEIKNIMKIKKKTFI
jgi:hypothetical protein